MLCDRKRHYAAELHTMSRIFHHSLKPMARWNNTSAGAFSLLGSHVMHGGPASWASIGRLEGLPLLRIGPCKLSAERTRTFILGAYNVTPPLGPHFGCVAAVLLAPKLDFSAVAIDKACGTYFHHILKVHTHIRLQPMYCSAESILTWLLYH